MPYGDKKERRRWILLLLFAALGAVCGVMLYRRPDGASVPSDSPFFGFGSWKTVCLGYLLLAAPYWAVFLSLFSRLTAGNCMAVAFLRCLLAGYLTLAMYDLRAAGSGGILCYLLWLTAEGELLLLLLCYMRRCMRLADEAMKTKRLLQEGVAFMLYCLGITAGVYLIRVLLLAAVDRIPQI